MKHTEQQFENALEHDMAVNGDYDIGWNTDYDAARGDFPRYVLDFLEQSQPKRTAKLRAVLKDKYEETVLVNLARERKLKGTLHVLRHGFKCYGKTLRLAYFRPASGLNAATLQRYADNQLHFVRQVAHNPNHPRRSVDVVLVLNGIPVVTIELKNAMTGQQTEEARAQYQKRDATVPLFAFKTGALVHFAVDTRQAWMTTHLRGGETFFLPFNQGHENSAGNPPTNEDYDTAYLWRDVLGRASLLEIIGSFVHLEVDKKQVRTDKGITTVTKEKMIFPRYHQLDSVRKLVAHAATNGSGHNYLVQHSAGSGKSNSIAWLAYRLANLYDAADEKIFHTVIVITDRRVLDSQLQDTIYQFEHTDGVVRPIDKDTKQLTEALLGGAPIVITTIQKFPFIAKALKKMGADAGAKEGDEEQGLAISTAGKRFAVIVDEAHGSQSGDTARELRKILNKDGIEAAVAAQLLDEEDDEDDALAGLSPEARIVAIRSAQSMARQPNLSFFAFTATPKYKTLALFNEPGPDGVSPFHYYSMRQAIEEGFIMDVLKNYTTYKSYYRLINLKDGNREVPKRAAAKKLARFIDFHPGVLDQKAEIIVEHFFHQTKNKLGGRAKAMIVTRSRLAAVRYKQAFDRYLQKRIAEDERYAGIRSLVAFSGTVNDPDTPEKTYTEVGMNDGIRERELVERFDGPDYNVLLVADKYQTGFDQPKLHTMYVDKKLSGVQAVQTLSRLNRIYPGKEDTFVLDFANDQDEIYAAFKPFFEVTKKDEEPDVSVLYRLQHQLNEYRLYTQAELLAFMEIYAAPTVDLGKRHHGKMDAVLQQAVRRYEELPENEQDAFRGLVTNYRNAYAFLGQVIPFGDGELETLYVYIRHLDPMLKRGASSEQIDLGDDVKLKYYRLAKIGEGSISLMVGEPEPVTGPKEVGTGRLDEEYVRLNSLIERLNDAFGTDFTVADQLFFEQMVAAGTEDEKVAAAAKANTPDNFTSFYERLFNELLIGRMEGNEEITSMAFTNDRFRNVVVKNVAQSIWERINATR
jgi:type I restriction enzyme R subunit